MLLELINVLCYGKVLACSLVVGEHLQLQAGANSAGAESLSIHSALKGCMHTLIVVQMTQSNVIFLLPIKGLFIDTFCREQQ